MHDERGLRLAPLRLRPAARSGSDGDRRWGHGIVIYLRQEARGVGLAQEIRAYAPLQDSLDFAGDLGRRAPEDTRRYDAAAAILRDLGVRSIRLLTNNTAKLDALRRLGVRVEREPLARAL